MKTITVICSLMLALMATDNNYETAMSSALASFGKASTIEAMQNSANSFERIAQVADSEWIPLYYEAYCYVIMSFMHEEAQQRDEYLKIANTAIEKMEEISPNNSEIWALKGYMYTATLVVDPMSRGQEYSIKSQQALAKALAINPNNPRALYLKLSNDVGTAEFFGKDASVYCPKIEDLMQNWETYDTSKGFEPSWGKNQLKRLTANCK